MKNSKSLLLLVLFAFLSIAEAKNILAGSWQYISVAEKTAAETLQKLPKGKSFKLNAQHFINLDTVANQKCKVFDKCIVYKDFELDADKKIAFGGAADWWFEVYLNGKKIYSTTKAGNQHADFGIDNHTFTANGKKGKNQLAVLITRGSSSGSFSFAEMDINSIDTDSPITITADKSKIKGDIKIMNAINNGPVKGHGWNPKGSGNMKAWQELKIPYGRTHDSSTLSAYGGEFIVDVHRIFRDFSKDPRDPASYDFSSTDRFLKMIEEGGTKVFYRLGATIEHTFKKYGTRVPADFKKWAVICEHIIRHYNEGWANGYKMNIEYWEIWNEPDLRGKPSPTWQGTPEQFFELYRTTALHLKKCFPHLKIGGPAITGSGVYNKWMEKFLTAMTKGERVPIDFFSWHCYAVDPRQVTGRVKRVREVLDQYGYTKTESILNEWNYVRSWTDSMHRINVITGIKGAAFTAAVMASCQQFPLDMLMYYDGRPSTWNGLFAQYTYKKLKTYYVFKAWSKLRDLGKEISLEYGNKKGIYGTAATDGKKVGIMLARYFEQDNLPKDLKITLKVPGVDLRGVKVYTIDENSDFTDSPYRITSDGDLVIYLKANSIVYIEK